MDAAETNDPNPRELTLFERRLYRATMEAVSVVNRASFNGIVPEPIHAPILSELGEAFARDRWTEREIAPGISMNPIALWDQVRALARQVPYCYSSERRAHTGAAKDLESGFGLIGPDLAQWRRFVQQKTARMSALAGD